MPELFKCPNCGIETAQLVYKETLVDGNKGTLVMCPKCPNYQAAPVIHKRRRGRPRNVEKKVEKIEDKFESFAISDEDRRRTQAMKPGIVRRDPAGKRLWDSLDGDVTRVFCYSDSPKFFEARQKRIHAKICANLGTDRYEIIKQDNFEVLARRISG